MLDSLIDKQDNFEIIRDQIVAILVTELDEQQALAVIAEKDPELWRLRVYKERSDPWEGFLDPEDTDKTPIVNVWFDNANYDKRASDRTERQKSISIYNIDVLGYGVSQDDGSTGHIPGDRTASLEAQRATRLVRNILMSAENRYLQLRDPVWDRFILDLTPFQPATINDDVTKIVGLRIKLEVEHNEFSPQVTLSTLELVTTEVFETDSGEVLLKANYDYTV